MSRGQRATLFAAVFFATVGVAMWASTLPSIGGFFLGMGWVLVLVEISKWEGSVERPVQGPRGVVLIPPPPMTIDERKRVSEDYRANHDVRDLATLPCRYGCTDPATCRFPHADCPHCIRAREAAAGAPLLTLVGREFDGG